MLTEIIKKSLETSFSYQQYMKMFEELVSQKRTTGTDQSEKMVQFTEINFQRMKRLNKTLSISEEAKNTLDNLPQKQLWLVITEAWCGDASQIIPALDKMAQHQENIELKLVLRDENEPLMNQFLTNGGKAIPMLIILNPETLEVLHKWGPRPQPATLLVEKCKADFGKFTDQCKEDLQRWYNQDKGQSIVSEVINLMQ